MTPATPQSPPTAAALRRLLPGCMLQDGKELEGRLRRWQQAGRQDPQVLEELHAQAVRSARLVEQRVRHLPRLHYPEELPITARKDEILQAIQQHPVVIVAGETGSGKSTQLPKICLEAGRGRRARIACTQPRRVAALSISRRIAEELGVSWGREVGCRIRFTDRTSPHTCIKLVTDGMLLAEIQGDRHLYEYDTIILDEAHERSLNTDYLLGYLKVLRRRRGDLRVIITSATIDTEAFSRAFDGAPVIEVSGRVYPVEVRYRPLDEVLEASGDCTYVDAAVQAVEQIANASPGGGDILVFMPTEADIREACDQLQGRALPGAEVLPLFGRLTAAEQQRVFSPAQKRRVVVATNVAETSLTIPRIRYVVDTGLARISRFNPRTRTQRLPIEPISRSSADQRQGRCGRVADGVCIRLYSEADYQSRPRYTEPEIQRADLADVILHMTAQRLGEIETFPFLDPPSPQAVRGGYQVLQELGALDEERRLTRLGRDMARLPIAPTDARMILEAQREGALREVLVIAAALGVQDPRERPLDQQEEADRVHQQFVDRSSDFLALLNIWDAYHDQLDRLGTQSGLRKFCRSHFLSYLRLREWRDIHAQLQQVVEEIGGFQINAEPAGYEAIHRSVLSGLLSNVACRQEGNLYRAARDREVMVFPGSGLFQRRQKRPKSAAGEQPEMEAAPEWIVAAEVVETSRLYARTVARIAPAWLAQIGAHLCRASYKEPYWNLRSGRVLVQETVTLHGLEILSRRVPYSRISPREATEIFIREALLPGQIHTPHDFLEHNLRLVEKLETWQTRIRRHATVDLDEAASSFYRQRLDEVSSVAELNRLVHDRAVADPRFLWMTEEDLLGPAQEGFDAGVFPDELDLDGCRLPLHYRYCPGEEQDGVTVKMPYKLVHALDPEVLEWLVPGLLEDKVAHLLRSLPKAVRRQLLPIPERARQIAAELRPTHPTFLESLEAFIRQRYRIAVRRSDWDPEQLPDHLRMRVEVQGTDDSPIAAGRDLGALARDLERPEGAAELAVWQAAARRYERPGLHQWTFGDLPARLEIAHVSGVPLYGYPGLAARETEVDLRLFRGEHEARLASQAGILRLAELALAEPLAWLRRELRQLESLKMLYASLGTLVQLREESLTHLEQHLFLRQEIHPLEQAAFEAMVERAAEELRHLAPRFLEVMERLLLVRHQVLVTPRPYPEMQADLERLVPADFLRRVPFARLPDQCRYLQAVLRRAERHRLQPGRDEQLAARVQPYARRARELLAEDLPPFSPRRQQVDAFRWMVEEYRVSVFAQELGTAMPVSPQRLDRQLERVEAT
ncbi:MAG: ATP-dependent RNA helicase HrpA [Candidatus Latescibacterota bacterium]